MTRRSVYVKCFVALLSDVPVREPNASEEAQTPAEGVGMASPPPQQAKAGRAEGDSSQRC